MSQEYTPNKSKSKHLCYELRLHLARLWNRRIESNDAKLTLGSFARQMGLDEESGGASTTGAAAPNRFSTTSDCTAGSTGATTRRRRSGRRLWPRANGVRASA